MDTLHNELHRTLLQPQHHINLDIFDLNVFKWTVQCVILHNIHYNSASTWLHSHNWIEEIDVDNWMQKNVCIANLYVNIDTISLI